ncbi:transcription-repair coupling factor [Neisseria meningitidis]|uniref:transcription-repair coupling factor n=1 Tax=Neisseria meningitidis TaxID=487 RepID=UPI0001FC0BB6|nr:transcription-repair coupling factor [Neisseria meningitidis]EGC64835.1 transcription-repair coupling factor [Neisseria meningitidis 961-5945]ADY93892.1 transcription-repair coupling factor [Neisseria meningitidis G2136]AKM91086.1 Transcription-repair-coupling factor [Neisseria meningitidis]ELK58329.1 transcription-repair coupling factor [Neisseria meningitidis 87255]CWM07891.1 transcription-repair coupling factor [Neisseria meningitidis]
MTYPIPKPREKSRWPNLSQGSLPLALVRYLPHKRLKVVLTQDAEQALRLQTAWRFFRPHDTAVFLPDWETLPYERFSPHQDLVSERLSALWQIKSGAADVLFVPVATAMQKLPPVPFLAGRTFWLKTGQTLDIGRLKTDLVDAGYNHVSHVVAAGEFAVRGGIVDLFPMGSEMPYRIDLFDDEIDSIKTFDTDTQRTISPVSEIRLLPAHEFPTDSEAQKIFRSRFREEVDGNPNDAAVYKAVSNGHFGAGVEYYLPLFFENELETLFDYIGEDALFVSLGDVHAEANRFWSDVKSRYAMAQGDETYPPLLPQHLYLSADVFAGRLKNYGQVLPDVSGKEHALPDLAVNRQSDEPLQALKDFQTAFEGRILLCAESLGRRETMLGFLQQNGLKAKSVSDWQGFLSAHEPLMITVAPLAYGFKLGGLQSPNQQQTTSASEGEGDAVTDQTEFSASATNPLPSPLPQEREQSAAAVSDSLKAAAVSTESSLPLGTSNLHGQIRQQPAPSPVGEGWGEGKAVAAQTEFSAAATNPLPNPLPQEREQSAAAVSDDLKTKSSLHPVANNLHGQIRQQPTPSPVGEGWGEGKAVAAQTEFSAAATNPLPSPLPQEREQSAAVVSDSLKAAAVSTESSLPPGKSNLHGQIQQQPAPSPVGEGWGEGKAVAAQSAIAVITESDLYQYVARSRVHNRRKKHAAVSDGLLRDLAEINIGDPVVHEEHGIGRYMGLITMDLGGETNEMMLLEYAGEAQLYVPVSQLHLISRYSGQAHENVALHKLGSGAWNKAKRKAAEKARDTAAELLNLYAQRAAQSGHKFEINELDYQAFADGFGYEETEDQAAAIAAVIKDLTQAKPMDRLVCGDVGFGKTEVALRAAFVAVMGGKQVAVLAPTTLLVEQHAQNFADRFADFPVKVASLSRFNNSKATKAALEGLADGTVDIVIGTHKLVQDNIRFKSLGLVIIDEEHRFGVRQKEQLKRLRANVDILTMTATPIPRTLSMALEGLRDFSLITTAPSRRLAVKTFVKPFSEGSVREAVLRELKRGGQVFFLHNEVDTIENMRERLETLLPEARIGVAHGQLRERELEQVMRDFLQQRFNVLLCSTIIETGIDIPNANTIIINRADKFGLAQLHQLRGRVGRSHHQAYAYLLTPEYITKDAEKRLDAIAAADELGAGFTLAMQDLEIRGAGEILGEGQSGEMIQVGFTLYTEMLKQAVRDLKKGRQPDLDAPLGITTEIKLHSPALLPESYCPDIHERLVLYKRLAVCETVQQINAIHEELVDRFGLPEQPVKTLIESHHLRLMAKELGIDAIDAAGEAVTVTFGKNNNVDPTEIILLIQNDKKYRLAGADKLRFTAEMENIEVRINTVKNVLKTLQNRCLPK